MDKPFSLVSYWEMLAILLKEVAILGTLLRCPIA